MGHSSRFYGASILAALSASVVIWVSPVGAYWSMPYYPPMQTYPVYYVPFENNMPVWNPYFPSYEQAVFASEPANANDSCDLENDFSHLQITVTGKPSSRALSTDKETICNAIDLVPIDHAKALEDLTIKYEGKKDGGERAQAGGQLMYITGELLELHNVFLHELGHNVDTGMLQGTYASGKSLFSSSKLVVYSDDPSIEFYSISWKSGIKLRGSAEGNFVSGYAMTNPQEDFAESYLMYITQGTTFRSWAAKNSVLKRKYEWLRDNLFDGEEYFTGAVSTDTIASSRPWDGTKL